MTVRRARVQDAPAIARVWYETWRISYRGLVPEAVLEALSLEHRTSHWQARLATGDGTLVAGEVDGYCRPLRESRDPDAAPGTAEIASLYVHPRRQRHGVGSALMAAALESLVGDVVTLWVFTDNEPARAFYAAAGFEPDGRTQLDPGTGLQEIRMRRELG